MDSANFDGRIAQASRMSPPGRYVCVFTASIEPIGQRYLDLAAEVGAELCRRKMNLVSGGGKVSTMGSIARTVRAGGGHTVGIIPRALYELEVGDDQVDELVVTTDMRERKGLMDARSDAFLALPGGMGTVEELIEAWVGKTLGMHSKPVVVLDPWGDLAGLQSLIRDLCQRGFIRDGVLQDVEWTDSVHSALEFIEAAWRLGPVPLAIMTREQALAALESD